MNITIEWGFPVTIAATVSGNTAAFIVPSATADQCHNSTTFQILMTTSDPTIVTAAAVGEFRRDDGGNCYPGGGVSYVE